MKFMKFHLSYRLIVGALLLISLILAGGFIIIAYIYRLQDTTTQIMAQNVQSQKAAQELEIILFHMRGLTYTYVLDKNPRWIAMLEEREKEFLASLNKARESANTPEESNLVQQIAALFNNYEQDLKNALAFQKQGRISKANALLIHAGRDLFDTIYEKCKAYIAANENARSVYEKRLNWINAAIRNAMIGLGIGGILLGSILGWVISRIILNPIYELVLKVRGAAESDLVEHIQMSPGEELKELDRHIHRLIEGINKAQADLEKNRRLLDRSARLAALGKIAAGVAHEIRNPLTAIKMLIYPMQDDPQSIQKEDMAVIVKEINRIDAFIQNFLKFASPGEPRFEPVKVSEVIRETLLLLGPRLRQGKIELVEKHVSESETISADAGQIKQVLMNLVLNAIDSMPGGGQLKIESRKINLTGSPNGKEVLQIRISDTGHGISESIKDTLFDPFVKGKGESVGLGLSISNQIVELHRGWIEADNNPDAGATFTINLPMNQ